MPETTITIDRDQRGGQRGFDQQFHLDGEELGHRIEVHAWLEDGPQGNAGEVTVSRVSGDNWRRPDEFVSYEKKLLKNPTDEEVGPRFGRWPKRRRRVKLAGISEIAALLSVSRQRANQLAKREDFPRPLDRLASGPVWRRSDIERWAKNR